MLGIHGPKVYNCSMKLNADKCDTTKHLTYLPFEFDINYGAISFTVDFLGSGEPCP